MATQRIAISVPSFFLKRLDEWARKSGKSRSRLIVEELGQRLKILEDEEITKLYNEVCGDQKMRADDHDLAEEMLNISSIHEEDEKW